MSRDDRRFGMPPLVVILVVATAASMPAAQKPTIAPNQNHVVLAADDASALQKALDSASSMGLHVLFGSHEGVFLSRARPADRGAYRAIRENSSDRLERALNTAGEQSFRLIPATLTRSEKGTIVVMRRATGVVTPYRYRVVPCNDGLEDAIRDLAFKGFSIVGVFTQQSGMAATVLGRPGRLYAVLEASGGVPITNATTPPGTQYRIVSTLRASTMEQELEQLAAEGYHIVGGSWMNVLVEKRAGSRRTHSYRVIGAIRGVTMQNEVDEAGRAGFRVVRAAIMGNPNSRAETVIVMERMPSSARRYDYLWVSASRLANSNALDNFSAVGFAPIALWRSGFMPLDEFGNPPDVDAESYFVLLENTRT